MSICEKCFGQEFTGCQNCKPITLTADEARRLRELRHAVGEFVLHNCNHEDDIVVAWQDVADIKLGGE